MADFIKSIGINGENVDFHFKRVWTADYPKYFVTLEYAGESISFDIKSSAKGWVIFPALPEWLKESEWKIKAAVATQE
jgi:hypothetical protein